MKDEEGSFKPNFQVLENIANNRNSKDAVIKFIENDCFAILFARYGLSQDGIDFLHVEVKGCIPHIETHTRTRGLAKKAVRNLLDKFCD